MIDVDVAVIGGGPGGVAAALEAARAGVGVALAEPGRIGGRAVHGTMLAWRALERAVDEAGGSDGGAGEAWAKAGAEAKRLADRWEARLRLRLEDAGVELLPARARFTSPNTLRLDDEREVRFERAVIAVGGSAAVLPGDAPDGERLLVPDGLLSLDAAPPELLVIGGGAAGAELVDALSRLGGTKLTWLMDDLGILPRFERELAEAVGDVLMARGVKLVHGHPVAEVRVHADRVEAKVQGGRTYAAPHAVLCVGTRASVDGLDLEAAGLSAASRLRVDDRCRTAVPHLFAIGDCTGASENVAGAEAMGRCAGRTATDEAAKDETPTDENEAPTDEAQWRPTEVPRVACTRPPIAQVGQTPERVAGREVLFHTLRLEETVFGLLHQIGERDDAKGFVRVVADSETGRILGASAAGPGAAEIASATAVALRLGATDDQLADVFAAVPGALDALTRAVR